MTNWEKIRRDFPVTRDKIYLASAGMSPIPNCVLDRYIQEYKKLNENGDIYWQEDMARYQDLRRKIGGWINTVSEDLVFVQNTSIGMSLLALALRDNIKKEFNVVSMPDEFPSTTVPFEYQGIKMRYVEPVGARYPIKNVLEKIDGNTAAVVTSYVQYCTGFRQDLEGLGAELKKLGVMLIVNATQGFPIFPVDVKKMNIDAMTVSFVKWGFAGHVGTLFYTSKNFRERFKTPIAGWLSVVPDEGDFIYTKKNQPIKLLDSADQYFFGGMNFQETNALNTALDYLSDIGFDNIRKHLLELTDYLIAGFNERNIKIISPIENAKERSAVIVFNLGGKTADCVPYLERQKIFASYRRGNVRVAVNIFNNRQDLDRLFAAIDEYVDL